MNKNSDDLFKKTFWNIVVGKKWTDILYEDFFSHNYVKYIITSLNEWYLNSDCLVYPERKNVFKAFRLCNYNDLKVVFIVDGPNTTIYSTGLAFACNKSGKYISDELQLLKDVISDYTRDSLEGFDDSLEYLAKQGVLLLNNKLIGIETLQDTQNLINIKTKNDRLWEFFMSLFLSSLSSNNSGLIFCLFGEQSRKYKNKINKNNFVFEYSSPKECMDNNKKFHINLREIDDILFNIYPENPIDWGGLWKDLPF